MSVDAGLGHSSGSFSHSQAPGKYKYCSAVRTRIQLTSFHPKLRTDNLKSLYWAHLRSHSVPCLPRFRPRIPHQLNDSMHLFYTGWILKHGCWLTHLSKGPEDKLSLQTRLWNTLIFQEVTCDIRSQ